MWTEVERMDGNSIAGRLTNTPTLLTGLKLGDPVTVDVVDVQDWLYEGPRGIEGGFSVRIIRESNGR
jgi:uncharacterized protein YegJ (DUF2314 family)